MLFSQNELKPLLKQASTNDPDLTSLHLSHKRITNKQLLQISDAMKNNSHVTEIWLDNNHISDGDSSGAVGYLMSALECNRTVEEVYLGGNKIGAKGASSIAELLRKNNVIADIGLEDNGICDGGAKMLADALSDNTSLQTLKLRGNDIQTEATLKSIQEKLKKNRDEAKKKLAVEHPELVTHKLKKPPPKEKKKKSSSRSGDERKRRSKSDDERKRRSKDGSSSRPRSSGEREERRKPSSSTAKNNAETANALLEERKNSMEGSNNPSSGGGLKDKFKGLGLGGKKPVEAAGGAGKAQSKGAAFV